MYNFIDVDDASGGVVLPSEAVKINGKYIENQISGYRTLHVSGREALSPELTTYETGVRDGSVVKNKRFPARTIIITYQLIAESSTAYREAYNKLAAILNVEDAELIFNDEPDKYFVGTPVVIGTPEPGRNAVIGEIEILCTDPFKYSVVEYEVAPNSAAGSFLIDYGGTYKSFPTLEADFHKETEVSEDGETAGILTGAGDCGFVAFFNENEKIIQLGDPEEEDSELVSGVASQTLVNQNFDKNNSWGTAAKNLWTINGASGLPVEIEQVGTPGMGIATPDVYTDIPATEGTLLDAKSKADKPYFNYKVSARAYNRTATTVDLDVTITVALGADESYFGYSLAVAFYINNQWHEIIFRKDSDPWWRGKTGHTKNKTFTVSGLKETTTAISGMKFKAYRIDSYGKAGTLNATNCKQLKISKYAYSAAKTYYLTAQSYGVGSKWHCASITRKIPADALGGVGASNFVLTYKQRISLGDEKNNSKQQGAFTALLVDDDGNRIAGLRIYKSKDGKKASIAYYVGNAMYTGKDFDITYAKWYTAKTVSAVDQSTTITKSGNTVTFKTFTGATVSYKDDAITDSKATKVIFAFEAYGTKPPLTYNGIYWAKLVKNNCDNIKDIPNKFTANDILTADCRNGEIILNGVAAPELGALGNDWEEFYLEPGLNQIGFAYSAWVADEHAPQVKIRYREVFL